MPIDSLYDVTPKFLGELEAWLEQKFFLKRNIAQIVGSTQGFHGVRTKAFGPDFTGTLTKTAGSATVTGSGTHFTTEVVGGSLYGARFYNAVGDETMTISSIGSDTSFTATGNAATTASGQTCVIDQMIPNATYTAVLYQGADNWDTDNYHFTSNAALTGTVSKTASSATITGSGTAFTTELSVNQAIRVPGGGGTDVLLVKSIESATSLTVWSNNLPVYTASGQTATKDPSVVGIPAGLGGYYLVVANDCWHVGAGGTERSSVLVFNGVPAHTNDKMTQIELGPSGAGVETDYSQSMIAYLNAGDIVRDYAYQDTGAAFGLTPPYWLSLGLLGT